MVDDVYVSDLSTKEKNGRGDKGKLVQCRAHQLVIPDPTSTPESTVNSPEARGVVM